MIPFLVTILLLAVTTADINARVEAALEPAAMDGVMLVQLAVEQGEDRLDSYLPRDECYAEWWALERSALSMTAQAFRAHVEGRNVDAEQMLAIAGWLRYIASIEKGDIECSIWR